MKVRRFYPSSVIRRAMKKPVNVLSFGEQAALLFGVKSGKLSELRGIGHRCVPNPFGK